MVSLKHHFVSAKADGPDTTVVKPSDWNHEHDFTVATKSVLGALAAGAVAELPLETAATGDDGTIWTKAQVQAAIAAIVAGIDIPTTGDLCATLAAAKPNWILANGQTIGNVGSPATFANAAAHNLFNLLWAINGATWPVVPSRGASALADWNAGHTIALPDARGCSLTMLDLGAGVNALVANLGVKVGRATRSLDITNIPSHTHPLPYPQSNATEQYLGGNGSGYSMWFNGSTQGTGPAGGGTGGVPAAFDVTSPTIGANIFIKL